MNLTRYLKQFLTVPLLQAMGGEYEGIIADVREECLRNRFKAASEEQAVVVFTDGKRLVLNKTMLLACIRWFGDDSKNFIGRRIRVFLREVATESRKTGQRRVVWQRAIACEDPHARIAVANPVATSAGSDDGDPDDAVAVTADAISWGEQ